MNVYFSDATLTLHQGDARTVLSTMDAGSADCVVTSPPYYGLRDYGQLGQIGLEASPAKYVAALAEVFAEMHRVLADDGTLWLNLGDTYNNTAANQNGTTGTFHKGGGRYDVMGSRRKQLLDPSLPVKNMLGIPWRVAFALQDAGWYLRNAIVWYKPNAMPESVRDRLSNRYELLFLLTKSTRYWFDLDPIREPLARPEALDEGIVFGGTNGGEGKVGGSARRGGGHRSVYGGGKHSGLADTPPGTKPQTNKGATGQRHTMTHARGRNPGDLWEIPTRPYPEAHFATFPIDLPRRCILAGCRPGGTVLDPFAGAGTTLLAAQQLGRRAVGVELNPDYLALTLRRLQDAPLFTDEEAAPA